MTLGNAPEVIFLRNVSGKDTASNWKGHGLRNVREDTQEDVALLIKNIRVDGISLAMDIRIGPRISQGMGEKGRSNIKSHEISSVTIVSCIGIGRRPIAVTRRE